MSGGHFDYQQFKIEEIADEIMREYKSNENHFSVKTLREFRRAILLLKQAFIYAHRIDWLLSGDDGEERFHERLQEELKRLKI